MVGSKPRIIEQYPSFSMAPAEREQLEKDWLRHSLEGTDSELAPCSEMAPCVIELTEWVEERNGKQEFKRNASYKGNICPLNLTD